MLLEAIPPAFLAALYPPALLVVAYLLAGPRPIRSASAYLAGAATMTLGVGAAFVVFLHGTGLDDSSKHRTIPPTIDIVLGAGMVVFAVVLARRPRRPPAAEPKERKQRDARGLFAFGAAMYLPSVFYLTALHAIAQSTAGALVISLSLVLVAVIVLLLVEIPIVLYLRAPDLTARVLDAWNTWLSRHGRKIVIVAAAGLGLYFVVKGIVTVV